MADQQPHVEPLGQHFYLVCARQGEDVIEIRVHANPSVIAQLTRDESDEARIIEATAAYLIARQRADDLPPQLDLEDVVAAYEDFEDELHRQLTSDDLGNVRAEREVGD